MWRGPKNLRVLRQHHNTCLASQVPAPAEQKGHIECARNPRLCHAFLGKRRLEPLEASRVRIRLGVCCFEFQG
jgi:hypothetical protein